VCESEMLQLSSQFVTVTAKCRSRALSVINNLWWSY